MDPKENTPTPNANPQEQGSSPGEGAPAVTPKDPADPAGQPTNPYETLIREKFGDLSIEEAVKKVEGLESLVGDQAVASARKDATQWREMTQGFAQERGISPEDAGAAILKTLSGNDPAPTVPPATPTVGDPSPQAEPVPAVNANSSELLKLQQEFALSEFLRGTPEAEAFKDSLREDHRLTSRPLDALWAEKYVPAIEAGSKLASEKEEEKSQAQTPSSARVAPPGGDPAPTAREDWRGSLKAQTEGLFGEQQK